MRHPPPLLNEPAKIVVMWRHFGQYHYARIGALRKLRAVAAIEFASGQRLSGWEVETRPHQDIVITLSNGNWEDQSQWLLSARILRVLSEVNPEAILVPWASDLPSLAAAVWGRVHKRRVVLMTDTTLRDRTRIWFRELPKRLLVRLLFDAALVSGVRATAFAHHLGFRDDRIATKYDVVDNEYFANRDGRTLEGPLNSNGHLLPREYFLFVGRMSPEKGIDILLQAYDLYAERGGRWDLVIVGSGPRSTVLRHIASTLRASKRIHFQGQGSSRHLSQYYYAHAKCLVLTSKKETWGLVVNEAMAAGLPVIISDACGCGDDLVRPNRTGFIFAAGSADELADCLARMSTLPEQTRVEMGGRARLLVAEYSPNAFARSVICLLKRI